MLPRSLVTCDQLEFYVETDLKAAQEPDALTAAQEPFQAAMDITWSELLCRGVGLTGAAWLLTTTAIFTP